MIHVSPEGFALPNGKKVEIEMTRANIVLRPVEYMTDEELFNTPAGSVFIFDVETYSNFFYIGFRCAKTKKVVSLELSLGSDFDRAKLQWMLWRFCFVGFNSKKYDIYMMLRALNDREVTNEQLKEMSNDIIQNDLFPFKIEQKYKIEVPNINHIDLIEVAPLSASLKVYGGRIHCNRMQDLPFHESRVLSYDEAQFVKNYCSNDLEITENLYFELQEQLSLREKMGEQYKLDLRSKSDAQIAEAVIGKEIASLTGQYPRKPTIHAGTQFRYIVPDFIRFQTPQLQKALADISGAYFEVSEAGEPKWPDGLGVMERGKDGKPHWFIPVKMGSSLYKVKMGGLHSSEKTTAYVANRDVILSDHDVESYYPRIILNQGLYPRHLGPAFLEVFGAIVERRVNAKRTGDKTTADSLKITINGTFGKLGSKHSIIYAPDLLLQVTISGQLCLLMLIEQFELNGISVISANTDGIVLRLRRDQLALRDRIIAEWEAQTQFKTEETRYLALYSKDVNNYIAVKQKQDKDSKEWLNEADGCKFKGAYSNPWADPKLAIFRFHKNPEATICIEAVEKFILNRTPLEETITNCKDIRKFVCVRTVKGGGHKDGVYLGKVVRWYYAEEDFTPIKYVASGNKVPKSEGATPLMDLPDAFPNNVNLKWYVQAAEEILQNVGCVPKMQSGRLI